MKRLILLTLLLVCGITFVAAQKGAEIHFESKTHDFGDVSMSNPIFKCVFPFTNTGDEALFINKVETSCHICMKAIYPTDSIKPGETGEIEIIFDTTNHHRFPGAFWKVYTVYINGATNFTRLFIKGRKVEDK